jgi:glutamate carboxypeptidase
MNIEALLENWVNRNSHFDNIAGIMAIQESIAHEAQGLGMLVDWHRAVYGKASALCSTLPSVQNGSPVDPKRTILLVAHADTVFPESSKFQSIRWNADRSQAIGPGVIDDKGGILVALLLCEKMSKLPNRECEVKLLCMPSEECGSPGYAKWMEAQSKTASMIFGFEPSLPDGAIIHSRRGNRWYEFKMKGPGGHAGRDAGKVTNPASDLMILMSQIAGIGEPRNGSSTTVGAFHTNTSGFNVIPNEATAKLDVRYETNALRDAVHAKILAVIASSGLNVEWTLVEDCPAMSLNPESIPIAEALIQEIEQIENRKVTMVAGSGSSDSNYLYQPGIPMVDGLGAVGTGLHTELETLEVASIETRAQAIFNVIQKL